MPMNKEAEQTMQTPKGVRLQGTLLMCLGVAMVIAGGASLYIHYKDTANAEQPTTTQEVQLNEEAEDPQGVQDTAVPEPDGTGSGAPAEPVSEPALEPEGYALPPAETVELRRCTYAEYPDGTSIQVCLPTKDK